MLDNGINATGTVVGPANAITIAVRFFQSRSTLAWLFPTVIAYVTAAVIYLRVPGIYMDAVVPDFLIVKLLHSSSHTFFPILPGNFISDKFPVLAQIYHGALPYYLGMPSYYLFGTSIEGIRLTNVTFGCMVLLGGGFFLQAFRVRSSLIAMALICVAVDPAFIFSFRSQFYITMLPISLVFSSIALVEYRRNDLKAFMLIFAGLLCGLAGYGYFLYLFVIPAALLHLFFVTWTTKSPTCSGVFWCFGASVGLSTYLIGELLIAQALGGFAGWSDFIRGSFGSLAPTGSHLSLTESALWFVDIVERDLMSAGTAVGLLNESARQYIPLYVRMLLLLAFPAAVLLLSLIRRRPSRGLIICAAVVAGLFVLSLVFGNRIGLHHVILVVPTVYVASAVASQWVVDRSNKAFIPILLLYCLLLLVPNIRGTVHMYQRLKITGGVGYSSDAILRFEEEFAQNSRPVFLMFPDWGILSSFAMVTGGKVDYDWSVRRDLAQKALCEGKELVLALVGKDYQERYHQLSETMRLPYPAIKEYRERRGSLVMTTGTWEPISPHDAYCRP